MIAEKLHRLPFSEPATIIITQAWASLATEWWQGVPLRRLMIASVSTGLVVATDRDHSVTSSRFLVSGIEFAYSTQSSIIFLQSSPNS